MVYIFWNIIVQFLAKESALQGYKNYKNKEIIAAQTPIITQRAYCNMPDMFTLG